MGPQAGADLLSTITRLTPAGKDQDHLSVILMSYPGLIEDRTAYMQGNVKVNPAIILSEIVHKLANAGAEVIGMACNSAHIPDIYDVVKQELRKKGCGADLLHMPDETCAYISHTFPDIQKVGILSTTGTYQAELYPQRLRKQGLTPLVPDEAFQHEVIHRMVYDAEYGIKSCADKVCDEVYEWLDEALTYFEKQGAEAIILGCTEFGLVLKDEEARGMKVINSTEALARALIRESSPSARSEVWKQTDPARL